VTGTDQNPLRTHLLVISEQELPEPARMFRLSGDGFGRAHAPLVHGSPVVGLQQVAHPLLTGKPLRRRGGDEFLPAPVPVADLVRCDDHLDLVLLQGLQIGFRPVARVGAEDIGGFFQILADLLHHRHLLALVIGSPAPPPLPRSLTAVIDRRLEVVGLHERFVAGEHDAALRIGEVRLRFRRGTDLLDLVLLAACRGGCGSGLGFGRRPGFLDLPEPALAMRQLVGELVASPVAAVPATLRAGRGILFPHQLRNLLLQPLLCLLQARVAHRLVLARVRVDLRAVDRDVCQLHDLGTLAEAKHLKEEIRQRLEMPPPEKSEVVRKSG
jgi:hypothetical protein